MKGRLLRLGRIIITIAIVVGVVAFARTVNWNDTWAAIRRSDVPLLVAAALVNLASLAVKGVRWWIFLRPVGATSLSLAFKATFAGAGLNNVLIANGGEAARVFFVSRTAGLPSSGVVATLALDRFFELAGYVIMLALAASFLALPPSIAEMRPVALVALLILGLLQVWLIRHPNDAAVVVAPAVGVWARTRQYGRNILQTLGGVSTPARFATALPLSIGAWALQVVTYHLTAIAAGFAIPLVGTVACILAVNVGFALRATPGNVGVFQIMYAVTAVFFGMDRNQAIAVAFLIQTQQILPVTAIGVAIAPELILRGRRGALGA